MPGPCVASTMFRIKIKRCVFAFSKFISTQFSSQALCISLFSIRFSATYLHFLSSVSHFSFVNPVFYGALRIFLFSIWFTTARLGFLSRALDFPFVNLVYHGALRLCGLTIRMVAAHFEVSRCQPALWRRALPLQFVNLPGIGAPKRLRYSSG